MVSVSVDFAVTSEKDAPYHFKAFDHSRADWDGFCDHLKGVPWNDIYIYIYINMVHERMLLRFLSAYKLV